MKSLFLIITLYGTFIYGSPHLDEKQQFWEMLSYLRSSPSNKWCIMGDSDIVVALDDKLGGSPFDLDKTRFYLDFIDCSSLVEIHIKGGSFTWYNHRKDGDTILEKLDIILSSIAWSISFPKAFGVMDVDIASDHSLIFLLLHGIHNRRVNSTSRVRNNQGEWLEHDPSIASYF
ncbi:hypothetical protein V6N12_002194 [Hibiscus sabdariffa]|uniref:Endonuclease/exonuclease/phosphatase domain-containing protein n=1 Tax=Hibiscus sabdariffa TaxID=183260 RepID=A0ABR2BHX6_9ROSI